MVIQVGYIYTWGLGLLLVANQSAIAMFWTAQSLPGVGHYVFTGKRLPCFVSFIKFNEKINILSLEREQQKQENQGLYHFYLNMTLLNNVFDVPRTIQGTVLPSLLSSLFPQNESFVFDSQKLILYKQIIDGPPVTDQNDDQQKQLLARHDATLLKWWTETRESLFSKSSQFVHITKPKDVAAIKKLLKTSLDTFVIRINELVAIENVSDIQFLWKKALGDLLVVSSEKRDRLNNHLQDLFKLSIELIGGKSGLDKKEQDQLQAYLESMISAHISYTVDLAQANLTSMLPRALYRAIEQMVKNFGVSVPTFDPRVYQRDVKYFLGIGALGVAVYQAAAKFKWSR